MIKNNTQLKVTKKKIKSFEKSLKEKSERPSDVHPVLWDAQFKEIEAQLKIMNQEVEEYNALVSGQIIDFEGSFNELPKDLIKARIARNLTQKELAKQLGKAEQQVQRWEKEEYKNASFNNIMQVIKALGVTVVEHVSLNKTKNYG
ncbi:MAG: helix-turn-helix transcriptional regulator [Nitrospinae bacterium]|nr:helix-turn-helix transcriptional regulator [Nitrospinota bacterium]